MCVRIIDGFAGSKIATHMTHHRPPNPCLSLQRGITAKKILNLTRAQTNTTSTVIARKEKTYRQPAVG